MRILSEGSADARPARFGRKINLRMECDADPNCQIFLSDNISKLSHQSNIANRCEAQGFTPLRKIHGSHRKDIAGEMVARVRGDGNRDAKPRLLGKTLKPVVPTCDNPRTWDLPKIEVIHLLMCD